MSGILFISHNALRTGAPISLLNILKEFKAQGMEFDVLLVKGGELESEFRKLSKNQLPVYTEIEAEGMFGKLKSDPKKKLFAGYKTIYANTVVTLQTATEIQSYSPAAQLILHVHELEMSVMKFGNPKLFESLAPKVDRFIAVSEAVQNYLVEKVKVPATKIALIHEAIDASAPAGDRARGMRTVGAGNQQTLYTVVGSGTTDWRKGPELFVLIAAQFKKIFGDDFLFVWVGGWEKIRQKELEYDIQKLGLHGQVKIQASTDDMKDYYAMADAFLLTSREDPYPLVCLEAASYGVPVICFENSGGMPEFVGEENGFVVPYLDVQAAAEKLVLLAKDIPLRSKLGANAKQAALKHDGKEIAKQIAEFLNSTAR